MPKIKAVHGMEDRKVVSQNEWRRPQGGNRGIGFEICRQLADRGAQVVLTAGKREAGEQAIKKLAAQNLSARFHPLNVTGAGERRRLARFSLTKKPPASK